MKILTAISQRIKILHFPILTISKDFGLENFKCPKLIDNPKLLNPIYVRFKNGINCIVFDGNFDINQKNSDYIVDDFNDYDVVIQHNKVVNKCIIILIKF